MMLRSVARTNYPIRDFSILGCFYPVSFCVLFELIEKLALEAELVLFPTSDPRMCMLNVLPGPLSGHRLLPNFVTGKKDNNTRATK